VTTIAPDRPTSLRSRWLIPLAALAAAASLGSWILVRGDSGGSPPTALSASAFVQATGIRITRVAVTAGGGVIDLRFQVVDPSKADVVHGEGALAVVDEQSGLALTRPFHFHSSDTRFRAGSTYYELLVNRSGLIEAGDSVAVRVGKTTLAHLRAR
jgi:hypothetical protein